MRPFPDPLLSFSLSGDAVLGDEVGWGFTGMGEVKEVGGAVVKSVGVVGASSIITMSG